MFEVYFKQINQVLLENKGTNYHFQVFRVVPMMVVVMTSMPR
jgi:hypothetical protein